MLGCAGYGLGPRQAIQQLSQASGAAVMSPRRRATRDTPLSREPMTCSPLLLLEPEYDGLISSSARIAAGSESLPAAARAAIAEGGPPSAKSLRHTDSDSTSGRQPHTLPSSISSKQPVANAPFSPGRGLMLRLCSLQALRCLADRPQKSPYARMPRPASGSFRTAFRERSAEHPLNHRNWKGELHVRTEGRSS